MQNRELALGIDLGGSKILTAVVDSQGKILSTDYRATPANSGLAAVIQEIRNSAESTLAQAGVTIDEISAVGFGAPGISNPETGILFSSPHLPGWSDIPLRDMMEKELGKKTFLINDAKAAALGEHCFGAGKGARNFIYITISTGIGGGIIINGELYFGAIGTAGEIGHMTIDTNGPRCTCGNSGCWEMFASGSALAREAKRLLGECVRTSILDYAHGDIDNVTAQVVETAARNGDTAANELIAQTGRYIGVGLANLINIFNPELIVIGGGLSNMGGLLLKPAFKEASARAYKEAYRAVRFSPAELGRNSGVIGAAAFAFRQIRMTC